jgi:hypothetical protein
MFNAASYNPNATGSIPKVLNPGSHISRIAGLSLDEPSYEAGKGSYFINVLLEGQPEGEGFEGIQIDKTNPALGRYKGKIATVKSGRYPFSDFTYQGKMITRDEQMFRFIMNLSTQLGVLESIQNDGVQGESIEEYFENVKPYLINRWAFFTLAGQEYFTEGYDKPNYRLFFPKGKAKIHPFSALKNEKGEVIQFLKFDPVEHIVVAKPADAAPSVDSFAPLSSGAGMSIPQSQPNTDLFAAPQQQQVAPQANKIPTQAQSFADFAAVSDGLDLPF